jgi:hypothetical protein
MENKEKGLAERWGAPTPKKWKDIQKILITALVALTALETGSFVVEGTEYAINLSPFLHNLIQKAIVIVAPAAFVIQFFTEDKE